ncbi:MAG TPA: replication-relaxation family protein [Methylomirabilota bacterium]|nr:replication-relaxation family protein [Methylomirabilota bacterium]
MKIPSIIIKLTKKQKEILYYLYQFRFLHTHQLQKLLKHKNPNRTLSWLKDLIEKKCVKKISEKKTFQDNAKPTIYYLGQKARHILQKEKDIKLADLEYIYSEGRREKKFIDRCLFLADVYWYLLSQKEPQEELKFFTKTMLRGYEYFPDPLPDAFISVKGEETTRRYFLDFFDEYTPTFVLRKRVKMYLDYVEKSDWDENTDFAQFPSILFICPNERVKKHIYYYAKSLFEKNYEDKISLFLTTKDKTHPINKDIWEKVRL